MFKTSFLLSLMFTATRARVIDSAHLLSPYHSQENVIAGENAFLKCPVQDSDHVIWYQGSRDVTSLNDPRWQVSSKGVFIIKNAKARDAGHYQCQYINKFKSGNVTLFVTEKQFNGDSELRISFPLLNKENNQEKKEQRKPKFKESQPDDFSLQRLEGKSVEMSCQADGYPLPKIKWTKNGSPLKKSELEVRARRTKYSLILDDLRVEDSGLYSCIVYNSIGMISANFDLKVMENDSPSEPELLGSDPINTTIYEGSAFTLLCQVKCFDEPQILWMKTVQPNAVPKLDWEKLIVLDGDHYQVLAPMKSLKRTNGTFLNKLHVSASTALHTGKYICVATNKFGYAFKEAYVQVLIKNVGTASKRMSFTSGLVTTISVSVGILLLLFVLFGCIRHSNTSASNTFVGKQVCQNKRPESISPENHKGEERKEVKLVAPLITSTQVPARFLVCQHCSRQTLKQQHYHRHYAKHFHHYDI